MLAKEKLDRRQTLLFVSPSSSRLSGSRDSRERKQIFAHITLISLRNSLAVSIDASWAEMKVRTFAKWWKMLSIISNRLQDQSTAEVCNELHLVYLFKIQLRRISERTIGEASASQIVLKQSISIVCLSYLIRHLNGTCRSGSIKRRTMQTFMKSTSH